MRDEGGEPQKKATSTVSRSGDGDVVLSLGEEPQFCAQVEQNDASHIYIDNGDMLTNLVNAYTGGATEQGVPAPKKPAGGHELCPFCWINFSRDKINAYRHLRKCQMS